MPRRTVSNTGHSDTVKEWVRQPCRPCGRITAHYRISIGYQCSRCDREDLERVQRKLGTR